MVSRNHLIAFIQDAERAWENVVFSYARSTPPLRIGGIDYYRLPLRFSTQKKVYQYYRQYWNRMYANRMICSAVFRNIRGRLYAPDADTGGLPSKVLDLRIISQTGTTIIVDAVLDDPNLARLTVRHVIRRNSQTGALAIVKRTSRYPDYRYEPCAEE